VRITPTILGALALGCCALVAHSAELTPEVTSNITSRGNYLNTRLKFETEKTGHVAFLGGSITQNAKGHSAMIPAWLESKFPDTEFTFTNAGISSTCSTTGAFRLQEHVLDKGPLDLLIVEFAVNDDQDAMHDRREALRGMEGIVRHVRSSSPKTDILMVQYVNPPILEKLEKGETPISISAHEAVADHYNISTVNVGGALAAGAMDWETYGGTHPGKDGYRLASDMMIHALNEGWKGDLPEAAVAHAFPEPLDDHSYAKGKLINPTEAAWMGGWESGLTSEALLPEGSIRNDYKSWELTVAAEPGAQLHFPFFGQAVGAFVLAGPDAGILECSIDGESFKAVDLYHSFSEKLNYPRTVMFYTDLDAGYHQLTLRVAPRKEGEPGGTRTPILKFVINE